MDFGLDHKIKMIRRTLLLIIEVLFAVTFGIVATLCLFVLFITWVPAYFISGKRIDVAGKIFDIGDKFLDMYEKLERQIIQ